MMGRLNHDQEQFFYSFRLDEAVPEDHPIREIARVLDLSWVHSELAAYYPRLGRPSIDPVLMIRMLIVGYVFAIRSERALCRDVRVNLPYRWFCGLSIEDKIPDHSAFSRARNERFGDSDMFRRVFERVVKACMAAGLVGGEGFAVDASLIVADANWSQPRLAGQRGEDRAAHSSHRQVETRGRDLQPRRLQVRQGAQRLYLPGQQNSHDDWDSDRRWRDASLYRQHIRLPGLPTQGALLSEGAFPQNPA